MRFQLKRTIWSVWYYDEKYQSRNIVEIKFWIISKSQNLFALSKICSQLRTNFFGIFRILLLSPYGIYVFTLMYISCNRILCSLGCIHIRRRCKQKSENFINASHFQVCFMAALKNRISRVVFVFAFR